MVCPLSLPPHQCASWLLFRVAYMAEASAPHCACLPEPCYTEPKRILASFVWYAGCFVEHLTETEVLNGAWVSGGQNAACCRAAALFRGEVGKAGGMASKGTQGPCGSSGGSPCCVCCAACCVRQAARGVSTCCMQHLLLERVLWHGRPCTAWAAATKACFEARRRALTILCGLPGSAVDDVMTLMRHGAENRHTGETRMNRESSRSHSVFTCTVEVRACCGAAGSPRRLKGGQLCEQAARDLFVPLCALQHAPALP